MQTAYSRAAFTPRGRIDREENFPLVTRETSIGCGIFLLRANWGPRDGTRIVFRTEGRNEWKLREHVEEASVRRAGHLKMQVIHLLKVGETIAQGGKLHAANQHV